MAIINNKFYITVFFIISMVEMNTRQIEKNSADSPLPKIMAGVISVLITFIGTPLLRSCAPETPDKVERIAIVKDLSSISGEVHDLANRIYSEGPYYNGASPVVGRDIYRAEWLDERKNRMLSLLGCNNPESLYIRPPRGSVIGVWEDGVSIEDNSRNYCSWCEETDFRGAYEKLNGEEKIEYENAMIGEGDWNFAYWSENVRSPGTRKP